LPRGQPQFSRRARDGSLSGVAAVEDLVQLAGDAPRHRPLLVRDQGMRRQGSIVKSLWQWASFEIVSEKSPRI